MSVQETQRVLEAYAASHDANLVAPDAIFTDTASGQQYVGREAIAAMLHFVYHEAFDAHAEVSNLIVGDGRAVLEADIVGTHIGEFAGIPATGLDVRIPLAVAYDISDGLVQRARVYLQLAAFLQQVTSRAQATSGRTR
ncbi:MAG: ester cyclase [Acidimicrobiia bacterium]